MKQSSCTINGHPFHLHVPQGGPEMERGYTAVKPKDGEAMLFQFPDHRYIHVTMREMKRPLDLVWLDNFKVVKIEEKARPPTWHFGAWATELLELKAGGVKKFKIKLGDAVVMTNNGEKTVAKKLAR